MTENPKFKVRMAVKRHQSINPNDISHFFRLLATLLNSGTPLYESLLLAAEQSESEKLATIANDLAQSVSQGTSLSDSALKHPKVFESHWIHMIRVGEATGQLGQIFEQLFDGLQKRQAMRRKIVSAMTYPLILGFVALASITVMLWKVIPTFAELLNDVEAKLPAITKYVLELSDLVQTRGHWILLGGIAIAFFSYRYLGTAGGKENYWKTVFRIPMVGEYFVLLTMEKFAANLGMLLKGGTPLLDAVHNVQEMFSDNVVYRQSLNDVRESLGRGNSLAYALKTTSVFPAMVVNMVKIGEESGSLPQVLEEVSNFYQSKVEHQLLAMMGALEPFIVIGMGVVIAILLGSVYLPMFQLSAGGVG